MTTDYRALCATAIELWDADCDMDGVIEEMRAALSQPQPPAGEVGELVAWLQDEADQYDCIQQAPNISRKLRRAAELLAQPPQPIPLSERLPGPGDCDAGRCYWGRQVNSRRWSWTFSIDPQGDTHWLPASTQVLPASALPLPSGEVKE